LTDAEAQQIFQKAYENAKKNKLTSKQRYRIYNGDTKDVLLTDMRDFKNFRSSVDALMYSS
jgi:hypothetical protein